MGGHEEFHELLPCDECDLVLPRPTLETGQRAVCPRCGHVLTVCRKEPFARGVSFSVAALVLLGISLRFPFLSISAQGIESTMTVRETIFLFYSEGRFVVATLVAGFIVLVPFTMLCSMIFLGTYLTRKKFSPRLIWVAKAMFSMHSWSMVEVFTLGVIVSLVKIVSLAKVTIGPAFWSYLLFSAVFLSAFQQFDRHAVWQRIRKLKESTGA